MDHSLPHALTAAENDKQTELRAVQAEQARTAYSQLYVTVLEKANEAAKSGLRFALFPVALMCVVGTAMIAAAMFDTVEAHPVAIRGDGPTIVVTGTALSTPEFIATMVVAAILLLAAPVVLHFAGELARSSVTNNAQPTLDNAAGDLKTQSDALAGAFDGYDRAKTYEP